MTITQVKRVEKVARELFKVTHTLINWSYAGDSLQQDYIDLAHHVIEREDAILAKVEDVVGEMVRFNDRNLIDANKKGLRISEENYADGYAHALDDIKDKLTALIKEARA